MSEAGEKKRQSRQNEIKEWLLSLIIVIAVAFVIRTFVFGTIVVKGISMEPSYSHGDVLIVNKFVYNISEPKAGDIIICGYNDAAGDNLIKRIIGVSGDSVDFLPKDDGNGYDVSINGEIISEDYTLNGTGFYGDEEYPFTVPEDCFFVMGDNRDNSTDSRWQSIGAIEKNDITGKVFIKIWPLWK